MISQKTVIEVEVAGKMYRLYCDNDSPLGCLHDALMMMKGIIVERMQMAQKEEEAIAIKMKQIDEQQAQEAAQVQSA